MTLPAGPDHPAGTRVRCVPCGLDLQTRSVKVGYLGSSFQVDLPQCPRCGQVYIPPDLALGKMFEVEQQLEDK
jgi:hypothetical protein